VKRSRAARALADTLRGGSTPSTTELEDLRLTEVELDGIERVVLIGCGSASTLA